MQLVILSLIEPPPMLISVVSRVHEYHEYSTGSLIVATWVDARDMLGCAETVVCSVGLKPWSFPLGKTHRVSDPEEEGLVGKR